MELEQDKYLEAMREANSIIDDNEWLKYETMTPQSMLAIAILYLNNNKEDNK